MVSSSEDDRPLVAKQHSHSGNVPNGKRKLSTSADSDASDRKPLAKRVKPNSATVAVNSRKRKKAAVSSDESDDDVPLASPAKPVASKATATSANRRAAKHSVSMEESDSDDDIPSKATATSPDRRAAKHSVSMKGESASDDDIPLKAKTKLKAATQAQSSDEDKPLASKPKKAKGTETTKLKPPPKKKVKKSEIDGGYSDDDKPLAKKKSAPKKPKVKEDGTSPAKAGKKEPTTPKSKRKKKEEELPVFRWWDQQDAREEDSSVKWKTLEHNGVLFPPPYEPLPSTVKMTYDGKPVDLPPEAEEVAGFFAALIDTEHGADETFQKNFFEDWQEVLKKQPPRNAIKIKDFDKCDFRPIYDHIKALDAIKKSLNKEDKAANKKKKDELEAPYLFCSLDGRQEKVGNFRIEPPGLFRGRGKHPKKGRLKSRIRPEDLIINIGPNARIPTPNIPGNWGKIVHDDKVTWLANWKENINSNFKYVFLAPGSSLKGQSDMNKFEKARDLKNHVDRIRADYTAEMKSKVMAERQRATAMYFIDVLALRAGNEKGEDEADTVGCCSLRYEHVMVDPPDKLIFDFLGKDSIRYFRNPQVTPQVIKNVKIFKENKSDNDDLFDRVTTASLNKHLQNYMKGLTAKVFRTYNASSTFQIQLDKMTPAEGTTQEKLAAYNKANREVAILCNHQRSITKSHHESMTKMERKLAYLKWERMKMRHALFAKNNEWKDDEELQDDESDLDEEAVATVEDRWLATEIEKAEKKFAKDNLKLESEGQELLDQSDLDAKIKALKEEHEKYVEERGTEEAVLKGNAKTEEKIRDMIKKQDDRIRTHKLQMTDKDEGKEVSLGTSKINYLDPRITAAWCKKHDVPIEKLFSKTLLVKFPWAREVDADWIF